MAKHHFILIVDEEVAIRQQLAQKIKQEELLQVIDVASLSEARHVCERRDIRINALFLQTDGFYEESVEFCAELRRQNMNMPILMMASSYTEDEVVQALDAGANDYVIKPLRLREVVARLRVQMRLFEQREDVVFDIGPYTFKPSQKILVNTTKNDRIYLTEKETAILKYLYRVGNEVVEREVLLNKVWGYSTGVTTHTLETHIYRLRQKIEINSQRNKILITKNGGYTLRA